MGTGVHRTTSGDHAAACKSFVVTNYVQDCPGNRRLLAKAIANRLSNEGVTPRKCLEDVAEPMQCELFAVVVFLSLVFFRWGGGPFSTSHRLSEPFPEPFPELVHHRRAALENHSTLSRHIIVHMHARDGCDNMQRRTTQPMRPSTPPAPRSSQKVARKGRCQG